MNTTKIMTLDEVKQLSLTDEERKIIKNAKPHFDADCPELTEEQIKEFRPWYEIHPNGNDNYKVSVTKKDIHIKIDSDVLEALKADGRGYQTRINAILRRSVFGV